MELTPFVESLQARLEAAAAVGGPESSALFERLAPGLDAAARVVLLDVLSAAVDEVTMEMAPGSVEIRLRGGEPEFVVSTPVADGDGLADDPQPAPQIVVDGDDDGNTARLNLRLPETLKARIDEAARREGLSLNTWLVRAAAAATPTTTPGRSTPGPQRFTGWVQ